MSKADDLKSEAEKTDESRSEFTSAADALLAGHDRVTGDHDGILSERDKVGAGRNEHRTQVANVAVTHKATSNDLKLALQEQRRTTTLLNAQVQDLKERCEDLEFELAKAREEVTAGRVRRKELARVIANRDAQLKVRYEELARLQQLMVRLNPWVRIKRSYGWLKRHLRDAGSPGTKSKG